MDTRQGGDPIYTTRSAPPIRQDSQNLRRQAVAASSASASSERAVAQASRPPAGRACGWFVGKGSGHHILLRPRHSDEPTQLAGGDDVDEDVEAALQHVWSERARQEAPASSSTTYVLSSLLCCSARKAE